MNIEDLKDDWRLTGQEEYLMNVILFRKAYDGDDHAHCEFCWHKFMKDPAGMENCSSEGYVTADGEYWICDNCYRDFYEPFGWILSMINTNNG